MIRSSSSTRPNRKPSRIVLAICAATLALLFVNVGSAVAEEGPPEKSALEKAQAQFADALDKHKKGKYLEAAKGYLRANELYPKPLFLYNAAVVYRLAGDKRNALTYYKRYLKLEPKGKGSVSARKFVEMLESELADSKAGDPDQGDGKGGDGSSAGDGKSDGREGGASGGLGGSASGGPDGNNSSGSAAPADLDGTGGGKRITGIAMGGIGLVLVATGVGFGVHARSLADEASTYQGPAGPELDDLFARGDAADRNMVVLVSAGALTTVAGALVYYLGVRDRARAKREIEIFATPKGAGIQGRF